MYRGVFDMRNHFFGRMSVLASKRKDADCVRQVNGEDACRRILTAGYAQNFEVQLNSHYLCLNPFRASLASAAASTICPMINASGVARGKIAIGVSDCDGPFDGGMSGPMRPCHTRDCFHR